MGQRQCSAPGSGNTLSGNVGESGSISDDWNAPGAHRDGGKESDETQRDGCLSDPLTLPPPSTVS